MSPSIKNNITDLYEKFMVPIHVSLYVVLMVCIVYVSKVPEKYKKYSNNTLVRLALFGLIVLMNNYISYMHALLLALFAVLFLSFSPGFIEKFEDVKKIAKKEHRWYDEKVLGEEPDTLETDKVTTEAIHN